MESTWNTLLQQSSSFGIRKSGKSVRGDLPRWAYTNISRGFPRLSSQSKHGEASMKIRTSVKGGGPLFNHNQSPAGIKVQSDVKAGPVFIKLGTIKGE